MLAGGYSIAAVGIWLLYKYRKDEKLSDAMTLALNDIQEKVPEVWHKIQPHLDERMKRYIKKDGKIVA